jgi:Polysaccharide deacetylase
MSGKVVFSLDFEIHWGVFDIEDIDGGYRDNLLGVRQAIPRILEIFDRYEISCTWAIVGFLFCKTKSEFYKYLPVTLPGYENKKLDPYKVDLGESESDDPFHFAPSLIDLIRKCKNQEIATHTYSHYYCLEAGQTIVSFSDDIKSAISIALSNGFNIESIVFPRNQVNQAYLNSLVEFGIKTYRGNPNLFQYNSNTLIAKIFRTVEIYFFNSRLIHPIPIKGTLINVPASFFLKPYSRFRVLNYLQLRKVLKGIEMAARESQLVHIWFHPHNFGKNVSQNIEILEIICDRISQLRDQGKLESVAMRDFALNKETRI